MTVVTVEYPGYGINDTVLTQNSIFETCEHFVDYFQTGKYETVPLYLYICSYMLILDMGIHLVAYLLSILHLNIPAFVVLSSKVLFQQFRAYLNTSAVQSELLTIGNGLIVRNT